MLVRKLLMVDALSPNHLEHTLPTPSDPPKVLWTNKVISVRLKVDPAAPTTFSGGILLFAQDTTWAGQYQWTAFPTDNEWHTYMLDMTGTTSVNPAQIIQFAVQIASAGAPTATDDAGVAPFTPTTVTAYIDTITVQ